LSIIFLDFLIDFGLKSVEPSFNVINWTWTLAFLISIDALSFSSCELKRPLIDQFIP